MTSIQFTKMHGIGNDYIYLDCIANPAYAGIDPNTIRQLSDRHKGIGVGGVVLILSSDDADFGMRMFNADGSEGAMCGNAIRCVGKYVADNGYTAADGISVATRSGIKHLQLHRESGKVATVAVDMGYASFSPAAIPMNRTDELIGRPVEYCTGCEVLQVVATALSVGNALRNSDGGRRPLSAGKMGGGVRKPPTLSRQDKHRDSRTCKSTTDTDARVGTRLGRDNGLRHRCLCHGCRILPPGAGRRSTPTLPFRSVVETLQLPVRPNIVLQ